MKTTTRETRISVIIPARNEEKFLPGCLAAIEEAKQWVNCPVETVVVINRCNDATEKIAADYGCTLTYNDQKNLASIRNTGVKAATGNIIVTIDADSYMSPKLLRDIVKALTNDNKIGGGVLMYPERWSLGILCTLFMILPITLIYRISAGVFFCTKETFEAIGGFNEEWHSAEDIEFARRLRKYGQTQNKSFTTIFSSYITTSCRKFDQFGDWYMIKNLPIFLRLLKSKDPEAANKFWYDVER